MSSWVALIGPSSAAASIATCARSVGLRCTTRSDVAAGEQQEVRHQPAHALRGAERGARRLALLAAAASLGEQLEVREHARQWRAQLVRGVGHELALARQHGLRLGLCGVELAEHSGERARQLRDLVVGLRLGH